MVFKLEIADWNWSWVIKHKKKTKKATSDNIAVENGKAKEPETSSLLHKDNSASGSQDTLSTHLDDYNYNAVNHNHELDVESNDNASMLQGEQNKQEISKNNKFCQSNETTFGYRLPGDSTCGPAGLLIRLTPGNNYTLILHNTANLTTNIHTHGLHLSGSGNADDVTRHVHPNDCLAYQWKIPKQALGGTFWLHAHPAGGSLEQLKGGAYSMLIVEDSPNLLDSLPSSQPHTSKTSIQQWLQNEQHLVAYTYKGRDNQAFTSNPINPKALHFQQNTWYRLRLMAVDPKGRRVDINLPKDCQVHLVSTDGVWLRKTPSLLNQPQLQPTGAGRLDLAILCPTTGNFPIAVNQQNVATIHVTETSSNTPTASIATLPYPFLQNQQPWTPHFPEYLPDLSNPNPNYPLQLQLHNFTMAHRTINGQSWDPQIPLLSFPFQSYQDWNLQGTQSHPFHLHVFHVQTFNCPPHVDGLFYDTIQSTSDQCRVRFYAADFAQRVVIHCHNVKHEDQGMMVWVNVTNGPIQDDYWRDEMVCSALP